MLGGWICIECTCYRCCYYCVCAFCVSHRNCSVQIFSDALSQGDKMKQTTRMKANRTTTKTCEINDVNTAQCELKSSLLLLDSFLLLQVLLLHHTNIIVLFALYIISPIVLMSISGERWYR